MKDKIDINGRLFIDVESFMDRIVKAKTNYLYPGTIYTSDDKEMDNICGALDQIGEGELANKLRRKYCEKRWIISKK